MKTHNNTLIVWSAWVDATNVPSWEKATANTDLVWISCSLRRCSITCEYKIYIDIKTIMGEKQNKSIFLMIFRQHKVDNLEPKQHWDCNANLLHWCVRWFLEGEKFVLNKTTNKFMFFWCKLSVELSIVNSFYHDTSPVFSD